MVCKTELDLLALLHAPLSLPPTTRDELVSRLASTMSATERSPLLPTSKPSTSGSSPAPSLRAHRVGMTAPVDGGGQQRASATSAAAHFYTEDDIAIEGMVLVLLQELEERGYTVPAGLVDPPVDMPLEEAEAEQAVLKTVFAVPRHRLVLNEYLPYLERATVLPSGAAEAGTSGAAGAGGRQAAGVVGGGSASTSTTPYSSTRPSPLSSQVLDSTVLTSPSALLLASLLSLLISLQTEVTAQVQETDRGVDGELRMFKARRELGERLYAVVGGLLDSYLLSGDQRDEEGEDALVTLLFHDFALNYDTMDRATCCEWFRFRSPLPISDDLADLLLSFQQPSTSSSTSPPTLSSKPKTSYPTPSFSPAPNMSGVTAFSPPPRKARIPR